MTQDEETKTCPFCGEEILAVAIKCKHCRTMLNESRDGGQKENGRPLWVKKEGSLTLWGRFLIVAGILLLITDFGMALKEKSGGDGQFMRPLSVVGILMALSGYYRCRKKKSTISADPREPVSAVAEKPPIEFDTKIVKTKGRLSFWGYLGILLGAAWVYYSFPLLDRAQNNDQVGVYLFVILSGFGIMAAGFLYGRNPPREEEPGGTGKR